MNNNIMQNTKEKSNIKYVTIFALTALLLGFFSALLTGDSSLLGVVNQPPLSPPPIVFGIVWSILYILIGGIFGAAYSYEGEINSTDRRDGLWFASIGFIFNLLWYPLFFGKGQFLASLIDIAVILILNIIVAIRFYRIKPIYGYLLILYIVWLAFALYLNLGIIILN